MRHASETKATTAVSVDQRLTRQMGRVYYRRALTRWDGPDVA
jgi:hypothetical protein